MSIPCYFSGLGACAPSRSLTNQDIEKLVDTSDEWIQTRTGIRSRHALLEGEQASDLAAEAARQALASSGWSAKDITHVIAATCTPEYLCPSTGCMVASKLDIPGPVMAFDVSAACSGFLYALDVARGLVTVTPGARILLVGVEGLSRRINWNDRGTCVLFGDGAGATIISADKPAGTPMGCIDDTLCDSDGRQGAMLTVGGGTHSSYKPGVNTLEDDFFIKMSGRDVFKFAVRNMVKICQNLLERNGLTLADIDLLVPHQANLRIIEAVSERLGMDAAKVFVNIQTMGNTSAASIPLALEEAWRTGAIKPGMRVLLVTFGGGFTWGASLMRF